MKSWEVEEMARKNGYRDGFDEGFNNGFSDGFSDGFNDGFSDAAEKMNQLIIRLSEAGRSEDLLKAAKDATYRDRLFEEFNLN